MEIKGLEIKFQISKRAKRKSNIREVYNDIQAKNTMIYRLTNRNCGLECAKIQAYRTGGARSGPKPKKTNQEIKGEQVG